MKRTGNQIPIGSRPISGNNNVNGRIDSSSPTTLMISTVQDILINSGFQQNANPLPVASGKMATQVLETFQVSISPEKKDFSLIRKQTSQLKIDNPSIVDPKIEFSKPGLADAEKLGIPYATDNTIFEQDDQIMPEKSRQMTTYKTIDKGQINLTVIAVRFCATQLSTSGIANKYITNNPLSTTVLFSGKGSTIMRTQSAKGARTPGMA
jgi:hypothetical protein